MAQTAQGTGSGSGSCSNAAAVSTLSTATHWTPGNVIGLCGTITSNITAEGSGTSGNPITVYWEPGASMTMSASSCSSQCLNISGQSYITLDGGTNGVITVPNNGDSGTTDIGVRGIAVSNASNITIEDLTIENLYVANSGVAKSYSGEDPAGVWVIDSPNFVLDHSTLSYAGDEGVLFANNEAIGTQTISDNNFVGENWDIASTNATDGAQGPWYIYGNHFGSMSNWDTPNDAWHHNGIFCYTANEGTYDPPVTFYIYNNLFNGDPGADATSWVDIQYCSNDTSNYDVFNNIFASQNEDPGNGDDNANEGNDNAYNNTFVGSGGGSESLLYMRNTGNHDVRNSIFWNGSVGEPSRSGCGGSAPSGYPCPTYSLNNNIYANSMGGSTMTFDCPPNNTEYSWTGGWSSWVSCIGANRMSGGSDETGSFGPPGSSETVTNPDLDSNDNPSSGSPALGTGQNLYSTCNGQPNPGLGALCYTYAGPQPSGTGAGPNGQWATPTARPTSGAWNIGAY